MIELVKASDCTIEYLGVQEVSVYDIETADNHNFFTADGLLLHNSNYLTLEEVVDRLELQFKSHQEFDEWAKMFVREVIQPEVNRALEEYARQYGIPNIIVFEYEKIIDSMFVVAGKNYALRVVSDDDGVYYDDDDPKGFKVTGIPIKKKTAQAAAKEYMSEVLKMFMRFQSKDEILNYLRPIKEQYQTMDIDDLTIMTKINDYDKYAYSMDDMVENGKPMYKSKCPAHVAAAINHNYIINAEGWDHIFPLGNDSLVQWMYVYPNNKYGVEVIGYTENLPDEFRDMFTVNRELTWEKGFMSMLTKWFETVGWGVPKLIETSMDNFFEFD